MDVLPYEIFSLIIGLDVTIYRGLLSIPYFTSFLTIGRIFDYAILFGYDVKVVSLGWGRYCTVWYLHNNIHRVNGPAISYDCNEEWYYKGLYHRLDGPAIIRNWCCGCGYYEAWYNKNKLHRTDGPAIIDKNKQIQKDKQIWCQNNKRHRENDPAVILKQYGIIYHKKWYIDDKWIKSEK